MPPPPVIRHFVVLPTIGTHREHLTLTCAGSLLGGSWSAKTAGRSLRPAPGRGVLAFHFPCQLWHLLEAVVGEMLS